MGGALPLLVFFLLIGAGSKPALGATFRLAGALHFINFLHIDAKERWERCVTVSSAF